MPTEIWASGPGCMWSEQERALRGGVRYIRADVVEKRVAEAIEKTCNECLATTKAILGAGDNEGVISAARRAVAERDERAHERDKYYAKARTYGASAYKYKQALESIAKQGIEEARRAVGWNGQHCIEDEHKAIDKLLSAEIERDTALARARDLTAASERAMLAHNELVDAVTAAMARAETAERELTIARDDYRKACEELRMQQDKTVAAERERQEMAEKVATVLRKLDEKERELGEARALIEAYRLRMTKITEACVEPRVKP